MQSQTVSGDSADTGATKGYVDGKSSGWASCVSYTHMRAVRLSNGWDGSATYLKQCVNGTMVYIG